MTPHLKKSGQVGSVQIDGIYLSNTMTKSIRVLTTRKQYVPCSWAINLSAQFEFFQIVVEKQYKLNADFKQGKGTGKICLGTILIVCFDTGEISPFFKLNLCACATVIKPFETTRDVNFHLFIPCTIDKSKLFYKLIKNNCY